MAKAINPLELYKKLPRKNCGKCRPRRCMPFALSVISGDAEVSDCPLLTEAEADELKRSYARSDWREELIADLRNKVRKVDFSGIAEGLGAGLKGDMLNLKCLGRDFTISQLGEINSPGRITPWIRILLLHYVRTGGCGPLSGRWSSFSELRAGGVKASSFLRDCEDPLREMLDRDYLKVERALLSMGAERRRDFPTEYAWHLHLLPRIPILILYWPAEEEFPSKVKILFDSSADRFLDVESLIFLCEGLVKNIEYFD